MSAIKALLNSLRTKQTPANSQVPGAPTPAPTPAPVVVPVQFAMPPAPAPAPTPSAPKIPFAFAPEQVQAFQQSAQQLNFAGNISDEAIAAALADPAAFRNLLNTIGQQAMASAVVMSAQHIGSQFDTHVTGLVKAQIPGHMSQMSLDQALAGNEVFSKSAMLKGAAKTRASELASQYPDASSQDILDVIVAEMQQEGIYPSANLSQPNQQQQQKSVATPVDQLANLWGNSAQANPAIDTQVPNANAAPAPAPIPQFTFQPVQSQ